MSTELIVMLVVALVHGGAIITFFRHYIRGLKKEIGSLNEVIDTQQKTLIALDERTSKMSEIQDKVTEAMEARVSESEKLSMLYRKTLDELPEFQKEYETRLIEIKDKLITEQKTAIEEKDEKLKLLTETQLKELEIYNQVIRDLPKVKETLEQTSEQFSQSIRNLNKATHFIKEYSQSASTESLPLLFFEFKTPSKSPRDFLSNLDYCSFESNRFYSLVFDLIGRTSSETPKTAGANKKKEDSKEK